MHASPHPAAIFDEELRAITALGDDRIRRDLEEAAQHPLPRVLTEPGVAVLATQLLDWAWTHIVADDWPRRERVLRADVVSRTSRLAAFGWETVLGELGGERAWLGAGRLRINAHQRPDLELEPGSDLLLVPHHGDGSGVGWDPPRRYALFYPVTGIRAEAPRTRLRAVERLIGGNRAAVLAALQTPTSTSALATSRALPLSSVSRHLEVMLDAGLVHRRRSGREVLYWRTSLGEALNAVAGCDGGGENR